MAASVSVPRRSSEFCSGRGGWGPDGQICREDIPVTSEVADAVISVGANQAAGITIQLNKPDGTPITHTQDFRLYVSTTAAFTALATTGGSTGIAIGANGAILVTVTSKKVFDVLTSATGLANLTWTDNASEVCFLQVRLPSGRLVASAQLPTS